MATRISSARLTTRATLAAAAKTLSCLTVAAHDLRAKTRLARVVLPPRRSITRRSSDGGRRRGYRGAAASKRPCLLGRQGR
jgi:hypothetical protein